MHPLTLLMAGGNAVMHNKIVWVKPLGHHVASMQASVNCSFHTMLIDPGRLEKKENK